MSDMELISIREAEKKDLQDIYCLICKLENLIFNKEEFEIIFEQNLSNNNILYLVAINSNTQCIGFISIHINLLLHHCARVAEIHEFIIEEEYRSTGIGTRLIDLVKEKAKERLCDMLEVTAQNKRIETHQFYLNRGFTQSHLKFTQSQIELIDSL